MVERKGREVIGQIRFGMAVAGYDIENLAIEAGISPSTMRRRMKDPGTFTLKELDTICKRLRISIGLGG